MIGVPTTRQGRLRVHSPEWIGEGGEARGHSPFSRARLGLCVLSYRRQPRRPGLAQRSCRHARQRLRESARPGSAPPRAARGHLGPGGPTQPPRQNDRIATHTSCALRLSSSLAGYQSARTGASELGQRQEVKPLARATPARARRRRGRPHERFHGGGLALLAKLRAFEASGESGACFARRRGLSPFGDPLPGPARPPRTRRGAGGPEARRRLAEGLGMTTRTPWDWECRPGGERSSPRALRARGGGAPGSAGERRPRPPRARIAAGDQGEGGRRARERTQRERTRVEAHGRGVLWSFDGTPPRSRRRGKGGEGRGRQGRRDDGDPKRLSRRGGGSGRSRRAPREDSAPARGSATRARDRQRSRERRSRGRRVFGAKPRPLPAEPRGHVPAQRLDRARDRRAQGGRPPRSGETRPRGVDRARDCAVPVADWTRAGAATDRRTAPTGHPRTPHGRGP